MIKFLTTNLVEDVNILFYSDGVNSFTQFCAFFLHEIFILISQFQGEVRGQTRQAIGRSFVRKHFTVADISIKSEKSSRSLDLICKKDFILASFSQMFFIKSLSHFVCVCSHTGMCSEQTRPFVESNIIPTEAMDQKSVTVCRRGFWLLHC